MGAGLNPYVILQGQQPQPIQNPIQLAEGVARVQQLQRQAALAPIQQAQAQQTLQQTQLQNQQTQQNMQERQQFGQLMADSGGDPDKMEAAAQKTFTDPNILDRVSNVASQIRQRNATMTARQHADSAAQQSLLAGRLQSVIDAPDTATAQSLWASVANDALKMKDDKGNPLLPPGSIDPTAVPDKAALAQVQSYLDANGQFHAKQAKDKAEAAETNQRLVTAQLKQKQDARQDIAAQYQSVVSPEDHQNWLNYIKQNYSGSNGAPNVYGEYSNLPYDPETTPDIVKNKAFLSQAQEARADQQNRMADIAQTRANVAGGRAGLVARMYEPDRPEETPEQGNARRAAAAQAVSTYDASRPATNGQQLAQQRYVERQQAADAKAHSTAYQSEQKQWGIASKYAGAIQAAGANENTTDSGVLNQTVKDPVTGHDATVGTLISSLQTARTQAQGLQQTVDNLEKKNGWGKYQTQAAPQTTPASAPPRTANTPPVSALKEGTATKFKNGQIWTLRNGQPTQLQSMPGAPAPAIAGQ